MKEFKTIVFNRIANLERDERERDDSLEMIKKLFYNKFK